MHKLKHIHSLKNTEITHKVQAQYLVKDKPKQTS